MMARTPESPGAPSRWSCGRCTFENEALATSCAVCLSERARATITSATPSGSLPTPSPVKRAKTAAATRKSPAQRGRMQSFLMGVGTSKEQEAQRLEKKIRQLRELGIDLPDCEIIPLLARSCYCVHVAASEYFEQSIAICANPESTAKHESTSEGPTRDDRISGAISYFEREFLGPPFRLLGRQLMRATITRAGCRLVVGERLLFQGENVGKKRGRGQTGASGPASKATASTPNGIVRVSTTTHAQVGRLDRELEIAYHPLLKEGLVSLGGVCEAPPVVADVFTPFEIHVFVFIHPRAFEIFHEDHTLFHLSDALYKVLDSVAPPSTAAHAMTGPSNEAPVPRELDALFSATVGPDLRGTSQSTPAAELEPYLRNIQLRSHQQQALAWMIWRETLPTPSSVGSSAEDGHPLWEKRTFVDESSFFINPFEKIACLEPPHPPSPCRGGILADDMGMGKTMMLLSLIAHRKHFGSATDQTTSSVGRRGPRRGRTLIICPLSLLHQWKDEIESRFRSHALSVTVYYGDERGAAAGRSSSLSRDVVLTTYGVLSSEFERLQTVKSILLETHWERVILDEAHSIKNRATTYFRSCALLEADHRWCLTGTPLQNSIDDVFSLLAFLRFEPWSRVAWWKRVIASPFDQGDEQALARLKIILQPILLRRTKLSRDSAGKPIVELPPKAIEVVRLEFTSDERAFYQAVYDRSRAEFKGYVASGTPMSSYIAIFALLLRLRQACNHPLLALGRDSEQDSASKAAQPDSAGRRRQRQESSADYFRRIAAQLHDDHGADCQARRLRPTSQYVQNVLTQIEEEGIDAQECPVCLDPPQRGVLTTCAHLLCEGCLRASLANDPDGGCPVCRVPVDMTKVYSLAGLSAVSTSNSSSRIKGRVETDDEPDADAGLFVSTKLRRLEADLGAIRAENARLVANGEVPHKVVVFSQWTHMLEMVARLLRQRGIGHRVFHGALAQETRAQVLAAFATDPSIEVLVISLKAGGVGLNLTRASVVILLDPWWNPGVEDQAIDRVHRLGQTRAVRVKRYVVRDTVEDMILRLQERKDTLARNVLLAAARGPAADEPHAERLSLDDLQAFFR